MDVRWEKLEFNETIYEFLVNEVSRGLLYELEIGYGYLVTLPKCRIGVVYRKDKFTLKQAKQDIERTWT